MDIRELGRLDLNLLVALEALIEERSVSRAAQRLFVTQSAMSKTLARLREVFDDPLFVRRASGMVPTPRTEQLAKQLPQVLQAVQAMLQPQDFDPQYYEGKFNLLIQGHMGIWLMPMLIRELCEKAPLIRLRCVSQVDQPFEQLGNGKLDFILQAQLHHYPPELQLTTIGYAPPILLARKGHPLEGREVSWEELLEYPHVQLMVEELTDIRFLTGDDTAFAEKLGKLVPKLETDQLFIAMQVVRNSDYLFPAPPLFMEQNEISRELIALRIPQDINLRYVMVTHPRIEHSAPHQFLYREIIAVIERFRASFNLPSLEELRERMQLDY